MKEKKMTSMQKYEADYNFAKYAAIRNLALVRKSKVCGCVRCGNIFLAERSMFFDFRFVEGPVCCPHCLCESVIPDAAGQPINPETLARLAHALRHYHDDDGLRQAHTLDEFILEDFDEQSSNTDKKKTNKDDDIKVCLLETVPKTTGEELFVEAMLSSRWDVVLKLVEFGFDPGKIRRTGDAENLSAIGLALEAGKDDVAETLYEAGDYLDDYCHPGGRGIAPEKAAKFKKGADGLSMHD